ncbi:hypothetical protein [Mesorhizobium amorphae]|uniref:hypothetical protein n=1 Tax=Mesorhizobium amorphae TaxID=71433 RepID=UPI00177BF127|nr:hypothetical protein [Mesorhizobium amorphae]
MQIAAGLLAALGDSLEALEGHLATMDESELEMLLASMPSKSAAGSAEMVMCVLLYREIEARKLRKNGNILLFRPI